MSDAADIERLETKLAFLERANNDLSDVVYRQHREIAALRARVESLAERVSSISVQDEAAPTLEDERPPHY